MPEKRGRVREEREGEGTTAAQRADHFTSLVVEHERRVHRTLSRLGVREADLEDAKQAVFLVVHRRLGDLLPRASFTTWLHGICVRVASEHRRRAHVRRELLPGELPDSAAPPTQEDAVALSEARESLSRMLAALDEDKRAVFVLFELEERPMAVVARLVGCPVQTAYYRLYAARREIDAILSGANGCA
ncbi:MAG: sigma-70 family RNA polymerase sigma factor [Polyangiaceae bacterium]